jgi:hypothetical protein
MANSWFSIADCCLLMKLSMNSPAQFHVGSIELEYRVRRGESIANPYTGLVHVFSDPLLLERTCPTIKGNEYSFIVRAKRGKMDKRIF